ncbi:CHAT domain-containing tetratricopeptide repeat protein [Paractinoplanes durhamensis]|nr:CHAT domain-containing protein [Actinoplanes durhamensis]
MPALLAALGQRLPTDPEPFSEPDAKPVAELVLKLTDPRLATADGKRRAQATATLIYEPARAGARNIESRRFEFTAPLGPIEAADLKWYLESYYLWPVGVFHQRASAIQDRLPGWGHDLYEAALSDPVAREALNAWQNAAGGAERRFSVMVDGDLPSGALAKAQAEASEAATGLLTLPWELLHDGRGWLFQGRDPVRVRRRLPNRQPQTEHPTALPVRILLVSPRPEEDRRVGYIDHRVSALPLVEAVEELGDLARLTVLQPPTYAALEKALRDGDQGQPFDVVHFDGHGVYDRRLGLGGLCFEDPADQDRLEKRRMDFVDAGRLANLVRQHRIPLVFLEACQSATTDVDPTASVAARLLDEGVTSVVAMSHSVLVETARRFVHRFYAELARGARVGAAMLAGQQELHADPVRGKILGAGELRLQDWFVPVLYQEEQDPQLITRIPAAAVRRQEARRRQLSLGDLPQPPEHQFQGRSRELLALERLLHRRSWAVVRGTGGQGKTTLTAELARWLVRTGRFARAAFVSLEHHQDARAVLDTLGHQIVGPNYTVATYRELDEAFRPLERALADQPTIVVIDNCESVLPDRAAEAPDPADASAAIFAVCRTLLDADERTRLVFTTRESLPAPFGEPGRERELGALDRADAVELVGEVMKRNDWTPPERDEGETPQQITDLVEAVNRHARALVLLAREVAHRGVLTTTADLRSLMNHLQLQHPGDRENSLYASVELSLRRLGPASRQHVRVLGVCHGGVHLGVFSELTGLGIEPVTELAQELIAVGLGEYLGEGHLRLDPGLAPYLLGELTAEEAEDFGRRWIDLMYSLTKSLYRESFRDAQHARRLTALELPNLMVMLDRLPPLQSAEELVSVAHNLETLLQPLGRPKALARAVAVREQAAQKLNDWTHSGYLAATAQIDRHVDKGNLPAAYATAQQLTTQSLAAGGDAYPHAAYDIAMAHARLGRVMKLSRAAEMAITPLKAALHGLQQLADAGDETANRMIGPILTELGDCMALLGRLEKAAEIYEEAHPRFLTFGDMRGAAVNKGQLATVRMNQERYDEALTAYAEVRDAFQQMGERMHVAVAWQKIGDVHRYVRNFEASEAAFREALAIRVKEDNLSGQASTLVELGYLYSEMGREEEAAAFERQAAEIFERLGNLASEGTVRNNLGSSLFTLGRYEEARGELHRAIKCSEPYGHAGQVWMPWSMLAMVEDETGHPEQAQVARQRALDSYLAYRHAGGEDRTGLADLFAVTSSAIRDNRQAEAHQQLDALLATDLPEWVPDVLRCLQMILAGDRDPAVADAAQLHYMAAAELHYLLETLDQGEPAGL